LTLNEVGKKGRPRWESEHNEITQSSAGVTGGRRCVSEAAKILKWGGNILHKRRTAKGKKLYRTTLKGARWDGKRGGGTRDEKEGTARKAEHARRGQLGKGKTKGVPQQANSARTGQKNEPQTGSEQCWGGPEVDHNTLGRSQRTRRKKCQIRMFEPMGMRCNCCEKSPKKLGEDEVPFSTSKGGELGATQNKQIEKRGAVKKKKTATSRKKKPPGCS